MHTHAYLGSHARLASSPIAQRDSRITLIELLPTSEGGRDLFKMRTGLDFPALHNPLVRRLIEAVRTRRGLSGYVVIALVAMLCGWAAVWNFCPRRPFAPRMQALGSRGRAPPVCALPRVRSKGPGVLELLQRAIRRGDCDTVKGILALVNAVHQVCPALVPYLFGLNCRLVCCGRTGSGRAAPDTLNPEGLFGARCGEELSASEYAFHEGARAPRVEECEGLANARPSAHR